MTPYPSRSAGAQRRPPMSRGHPPRRRLPFWLPVLALAACSDPTRPPDPEAVRPASALAEGGAASLELFPDSAYFEVGGYFYFSAIVRDSLGDSISAVVDFTMLDSTVARVDSSGLALGLNPGQTWLVASAGAGVSDSSVVTVFESVPPPEPPSVVVLSPDQAVLDPGESLQFIGYVVESTGDTIFGSVSYALTDSAVAQVDSAGFLTALAPGGTLLIGNSGAAVPDTAWVTVREPVVPPGGPAELILTPDSAVIEIGVSHLFEATVIDSVGAEFPSTIAFAVLDPAVASVDTLGVVTGVGAGATWLFASAHGLSDSSFVSVPAPDPIEEIQALIQDVESLAAAGALSGRSHNALLGRLHAAIEAISEGDVDEAIDALYAFVQQAQALLPESQSGPLIDHALAVIALLDG